MNQNRSKKSLELIACTSIWESNSTIILFIQWSFSQLNIAREAKVSACKESRILGKSIRQYSKVDH